MNIIISNTSSKPIYEQITSQIKGMIMEGSLKAGDALPSIRFFAKELRISVITTKRAYEDLEKEGFIVTQQGKGSFVAESNIEIVREEQFRKIEDCLQQAIDYARTGGIDSKQLQEILTTLYGEEE